MIRSIVLIILATYIILHLIGIYTYHRWGGWGWDGADFEVWSDGRSLPLGRHCKLYIKYSPLFERDIILYIIIYTKS